MSAIGVTPASFADRREYLERFGDPTKWRTLNLPPMREGNYRGKEEQVRVAAKMTMHENYIVGACIRRMSSQQLADLLGVSREAIDRRLRPRGLKNPKGYVGRPPQSGS